MSSKTIVTVIFLWCFSALAQSDTINLRIVAPEIKPLIYKNSENEVCGLIVDTLKEVSKNTNIQISVKISPWARALRQVNQGQSDAIMPALYTEERAQLITYPTEPLIHFYSSVIIKRKDDPFQYQSLSKIGSNKIIAKVRAMLIDKEFDQAYSKNQLNVVEVLTLDDALQMLLRGRVDLVVADSSLANTTISDMKIKDDVTRILLSDQWTPSYLAFAKEFAKKHDVNEIMTVINQFNNPGSYFQ